MSTQLFVVFSLYFVLVVYFSKYHLHGSSHSPPFQHAYIYIPCIYDARVHARFLFAVGAEALNLTCWNDYSGICQPLFPFQAPRFASFRGDNRLSVTFVAE